ncbi:class I SAM-dependent methyltransferase [Oscillatoria sp. CS-180]|uniref:class I SAM-dependent methyltransferase n=1 Tax=Oscillatoria sp. CS-180 TaxID=3021720 RepID=UPI00232E9E5C|nr:class I SAM-dependent methyltransferase [Oscillatoria sp. CS-180]MDB9525148.1 class I SAM-dependent methyltransferase [Oscillatoria sp. CS-180]
MSTWSSGYNTDLGYTFGFYREISPEWLDYVALTRSVTPPSEQWRYLELGCGQGYGLTLLAALNPDHDFLGIDFNPVHVTHARGLVRASGLSNIHFEEADFLETAKEWPAAWGQFDYLSAHGIYSWMSSDVCRAIVQTVDHAAAPGALFYVSYNALPAWVSSYPIQHLMRLWQTAESLESVKAIETGISRLQDITEAQAGMAKLLPGMKAMLEKVGSRDRAYLVQEYLHDNWHPRWFDQVVDELKPAKLNYVGTASLSDLYIASFMPDKFKSILNTYSDPIVREVIIDVLTNQSFRRDVFSRGATPLWPIQRRDALLQQRFALVNRPGNVEEVKFKTSIGELKGKSEIYTLFYEELGSGPKTAAELMSVKTSKALNLGDISQAISFMLSAGHITFFRPPHDRGPALALNKAIAIAVAEGAPYRFVIASRIGHVLTVSDVDLMFLAETFNNPNVAAVDLGSALTTRLLTLGRGLTQNGKPLTTQETLLPYAEELAQKFLHQTLPKWKELGVCA